MQRVGCFAGGLVNPSPAGPSTSNEQLTNTSYALASVVPMRPTQSPEVCAVLRNLGSFVANALMVARRVRSSSASVSRRSTTRSGAMSSSAACLRSGVSCTCSVKMSRAGFAAIGAMRIWPRLSSCRSSYSSHCKSVLSPPASGAVVTLTRSGFDVWNRSRGAGGALCGSGSPGLQLRSTSHAASIATTSRPPMRQLFMFRRLPSAGGARKLRTISTRRCLT